MSSSLYQPRHKKSVGRTFTFNKSYDNLYDRAWERYRLEFLKHNPRCYCCSEKATIVDHITPHKGNVDLFKKTDNHLPLCKRHHDTITAKFDKNFMPGYPIGPKLAWISKERIKNECSGPVKVIPVYEIR